MTSNWGPGSSRITGRSVGRSPIPGSTPLTGLKPWLGMVEAVGPTPTPPIPSQLEESPNLEEEAAVAVGMPALLTRPKRRVRTGAAMILLSTVALLPPRLGVEGAPLSSTATGTPGQMVMRTSRAREVLAAPDKLRPPVAQQEELAGLGDTQAVAVAVAALPPQEAAP